MSFGIDKSSFLPTNEKTHKFFAHERRECFTTGNSLPVHARLLNVLDLPVGNVYTDVIWPNAVRFGRHYLFCCEFKWMGGGKVA